MVSGRNIGSYIFSCFNGYGKIGVIGVGVIFYYYWQIELFMVIFSNVQVNNIVIVVNGQCYLFNSYGFCWEDYIIFVFMVFIIKYYYIVFFMQCSQCIFNMFERCIKRGKQCLIYGKKILLKLWLLELGQFQEWWYIVKIM